MNNPLLVFNPDHDLALGNGDPNFVPPASALTFAREGAWLPAWLYPRGTVWCPNAIDDEYLNICHKLDVQTIPESEVSRINFTEIIPWGWDPLVVNNLQKMGVAKSLFPSQEELQKIKELSNRGMAVSGLQYLKMHSPFAASLPEVAPVIAREPEEVEHFLSQHRHIVLKSPLSGSGKGLRWSSDSLTTHDAGWIRNVILKQGSCIAEKRYAVKQDFAMEFECRGEVRFCGYSLFNTVGGSYCGNQLLSNEKIENILTRHIDLEIIINIKNLLIDFLNLHFVPFYTGFLGVDMFLYEENGSKLHPCVEINVRHTMGLLARRFRDDYLVPEARGTLTTHYFNNSKGTSDFIEQLSRQSAPVIEGGKIARGTWPLFPLTPESHYAVVVMVEN